MNLIEIKHDRLSEPERFLLAIFCGLKKYDNVDNINHIIYKYDDIVMFEYDSKYQYLWYSHERIQTVFRDNFKYNYKDTTEFVRSMVEDYLNLKVIANFSFEFNDNMM